MPSQFDPPSNSLLPVGSNIVITGGSFVQSNDATKALNPLYDKVSPNAILKNGRTDAVRCYPGTREGVIARIERWRRASHIAGHPIFWLSGPAGAGKSAILQTIAERCVGEKVPMVSFFFYRADATRNDTTPIVATLLFQLFKLFPVLKTHILNIAAEDPVSLRQSMEEQFSTLIEEPLLAVRQTTAHGPPIVLIDGLDECASGHGKEQQISLLHILHNISTKTNPAFIVLVASRNEAHLTMTFNGIGTSPDSIYLDESCNPYDDIRLFVSAEFSRIRRTHSLTSSLDPDWPLPTDIDSISHKSSGQFLYAATIMRFIATSPGSPKRSLEIVLGLRPVPKTSPFATLDTLYTYILSQAEDWESVQDILAAHKLLSKPTMFKLTLNPPDLHHVLVPLGYTKDDILSYLSELAAIVRYSVERAQLTVFHASLADFLCDKSRAGRFYIDMNAFVCRLAPLHFKQSDNSRYLYHSFQILSVVTEPDRILDKFWRSYLPDVDKFICKDDFYTDFLLVESEQCVDILLLLYQSRDSQLCESITNRWRAWFAIFKNAEEVQRNSHTEENAVAIEGHNVDPLPIVEKKPRKKWSSKETQMLVKGCNKYGVGNWKIILQDPELEFHDRSAVDLKDRFRTYFPDAYKKHYPNAKTHLSTKVRATFPDGSSIFEKTRSKRRRPFTEAEDCALKAGYDKHGTTWATIVKDPIFQEQNRRSTDLRDRFKNAFPDLYQAAGYKPRTAAKKIKADGPVRAADDQLSMSAAGPVRSQRRAQRMQGNLRGGIKSVPQGTSCSADEESSGEEDEQESAGFKSPSTLVLVENISTAAIRSRRSSPTQSNSAGNVSTLSSTAPESFSIGTDDDEMQLIMEDADPLSIPDFLPNTTHSNMETWPSGLNTPTHSSAAAWSTAGASPTSSQMSDFMSQTSGSNHHNISSASSPYMPRQNDLVRNNQARLASPWTTDWFSPNPRLEPNASTNGNATQARIPHGRASPAGRRSRSTPR